MANSDLLQIEGTVIESNKGNLFKIQLDNDLEISAKLGGRMRRHRIRVVEGDRVQVGLSPYDVSHGLIIYRYR
jgi:translation initiation factor IF-1